MAPISTSMDATVAVLTIFDRAHLDAFVDIVESFTSAFLGAVTFEDEFAFGDDPFGGTPLGVPELDPETDAALRELAELVAPDANGAACVLDNLYFFAGAQQLEELARAFREDDEPSADAYQVFEFAIESCGG